jgi:non-canonical poly(A) RNA polymerase PAPD5/7
MGNVFDRDNNNHDKRDRNPRRSRSPIAHMHQFGRDEYRPQRETRGYQDDRSYREQGRTEFTFRSENQAQFPPTGPRSFERKGRGRGGKNGTSRRDWQERKPWAPKAAVDRDILHSKVDRETTPERLTGMSGAPNRFKNLDELSESGSDMDMDSGYEDSAGEANEDNAHASKRTKQSSAGMDGNSVPKWSNPDPYTALPPVDEPRGKKTDVVEFIRKAKVAAEQEKEKSQRNDVADNVDFISFGMDDDESTAHSEQLSVEDAPAAAGQAITGSMNDLPRRPPVSTSSTSNQFSHLNNLHSMLNATPISAGNQQSSALDQWPPPPPPPLDDLPLPPPPTLSHRQPHGKKRKRPLVGDIEPEWEAIDRATATPWCTEDHSETESMGHV